jgi:hypothetical protein
MTEMGHATSSTPALPSEAQRRPCVAQRGPDWAQLGHAMSLTPALPSEAQLGHAMSLTPALPSEAQRRPCVAQRVRSCTASC